MYNNQFFESTNMGSANSALEIWPLLTDNFEISSVLDAGCGQGAWLAVWDNFGVSDVWGIDGEYVDRDKLLIESNQFCSLNLSRPFNSNRRFDLVQSLEVAGHLPENSALDFVNSPGFTS